MSCNLSLTSEKSQVYFSGLSPETGPEAFEKRDFVRSTSLRLIAFGSGHVFNAVADKINDCVAGLAFKEHEHCGGPAL